MRNKLAFILFFAFVAFFVPSICFAEVSVIDKGYQENVKSYDVQININHDRSLDITEKITYDFGNNQKHGIYRYIPTYYGGRLGSPYLSIEKVSVTNEKGIPYEINTEDGVRQYNIRIGSEDFLVTGTKNYIISYKVMNGVGVYDNREELYWNAIGYGWLVPIKDITVTLTGEDDLISKSNFECFFGYSGSLDTCAKLPDENQSVGYSIKEISSTQAVSVKSVYEKGTFEGISDFEMFFWETRWYLAIPIIFALGYIISWFLWGRDPAKSGAIVVQYDPPKGMTPMVAGIITNPISPAIKYLPAEIIQLAISGYIKIKQIENKGFLKWGKDYELVKLKDVDSKLVHYQQDMMNAFFEGRETAKLSSLKTDISFGEKIRDIPTRARRLTKETGYFKFSPVVALTFALAITGMLIAGSAAIFGFFEADIFGYIFMAPVWILMAWLAFLMPKRTLQGAKTREYLAGLKIYINYAEKDRIKFLNAPKMTPEKFEKLLPYAMIFGLEKQWAKQFEGIYTQPTWYEGNFVGGFTVGALSHDLGSFASVASASSSAASGGGGAGGGAGGGGGGSW